MVIQQASWESSDGLKFNLRLDISYVGRLKICYIIYVPVYVTVSALLTAGAGICGTTALSPKSGVGNLLIIVCAND